MVPNVRKAATPSLRDADAAAEAEALAWSVLATKEQTMAVRAAMTPDAMAQEVAARWASWSKAASLAEAVRSVLLLAE